MPPALAVSPLLNVQIMSGLQNAMSASREPDITYNRSKAEWWAEQGEKLVECIEFWIAFRPLLGIIADLKLAKLASQLERISDNAEGWIEMGVA